MDSKRTSDYLTPRVKQKKNTFVLIRFGHDLMATPLSLELFTKIISNDEFTTQARACRRCQDGGNDQADEVLEE